MTESHDYPSIWLAPSCGQGDCGDERCWCWDRSVFDRCKECDLGPTEYVLASRLTSAEAERDDLRRQVETLRDALEPFCIHRNAPMPAYSVAAPDSRTLTVRTTVGASRRAGEAYAATAPATDAGHD